MTWTSAMHATAARAERLASMGNAVQLQDRDLMQRSLDRGARTASASIHELLPDKVVFHPLLDDASLAFYLERVVPHSVEILAHASGHTTVRTGNVWFDFRGRAPAFEWMDKHRFDGVNAALLRRLLAQHPAEGVPPFAPTQFGFSVLWLLTDDEVRGIERVFHEQPQELPWEATGTRGETCLSLATGVLERHAPQLGVRRSPGAEFFVRALAPGSGVDVVGFYTAARFSLFDFVADVIAQESTTAERIRALLSFVPPPLQPALDAAIRGSGGAVPAFDAQAKAMVPPLSAWTLARHAVAFALRQVRAQRSQRSKVAPPAVAGEQPASREPR